jgi:hypothetical protein
MRYTNQANALALISPRASSYVGCSHQTWPVPLSEETGFFVIVVIELIATRQRSRYGLNVLDGQMFPLQLGPSLNGPFFVHFDYIELIL